MKIKKTFKKIWSSNKGYTLIEMLAVIVVFSIIGGIITAIFSSSLRGSNKVKVTNEVRENGNYALLQMSRMIIYAKNFNGVSINGADGSYVNECYVSPVLDGTPTPAPQEYHYLKITTFDGGEIIFSCDANSDEKIASNGASLINTNMIAVDSCRFHCIQSTISQPPTIRISFTLSQKNATGFFENKATMPFETSVTMRNL